MTFGQCPTRVNPWAVGPSQQAVSQLSTAHSAPTSSRVASSSISPAACRSRLSVSPSDSIPIPQSQTLGKPGGRHRRPTSATPRRCYRTAIAQREAAASGQRRPRGHRRACELCSAPAEAEKAGSIRRAGLPGPSSSATRTRPPDGVY